MGFLGSKREYRKFGVRASQEDRRKLQIHLEVCVYSMFVLVLFATMMHAVFSFCIY